MLEKIPTMVRSYIPWFLREYCGYSCLTRYGAGVAVLDNLLYAVGGHNGRTRLSSVERLDPRVGKWENVCPMLEPRYHFGTAVFDGHLYAAGGEGGSTSVEKYSPLANKWISVPTMKMNKGFLLLYSKELEHKNIANLSASLIQTLGCSKDFHCRQRLAVVNGKFYALGGGGDASVEVFDSETSTWEHHSNMNEM
ncbi:kelch repeat protein [Cooperia oncophora]